MSTSKSDVTELHIEIEGVLDQEIEQPPEIPTYVSRVIFDLRRWRSINSVGIRAFMKWMDRFSTMEVTFRHCPKFFIDQLNMLSSMIPPNAVIESFFVPYYSEALDESATVLYRSGIEFRKEKDGFSLHHPFVPDSEGNTCVLDVQEAKFFSFLRARR